MPNKQSKPRPVQKGETHTVEIHSLANGGDGVANLDGYTVFVSGSAPGDKLEVIISQAKKTYARAYVKNVITPGPDRVKPACPVADKCGGCSWMHLDYAAQLAAKSGFLRETLQRIGGLKNVPVGPMTGAISRLGFRNKALVPVRRGAGGESKVGFFIEGTHNIVSLPSEGCRVQSEPMNEVIRFVRQRLAEKDWDPYVEGGKGLLRHLLLRDNEVGQVMLALVTTRALEGKLLEEAASWIKSCKPLVSVLNHINADPGNAVLGGETVSVAGPERLEETMGRWRFTLSAESFFQVNREQTPRLWKGLERARSWSGMETVMELYCGAGTLSLPLAALAGKVIGFESSKSAIADARANAARNQLSNLRFEHMSAERAFEWLWGEGTQPDVIVVDPPRAGLSDEVMAALLTYLPAEILYVSCDPGTLARDLSRLVQAGYSPKSIEPFDLFPQTWHVESVTALKLEGGTD